MSRKDAEIVGCRSWSKMDRRIRRGVTIEISGRCQAQCPYCARERFRPDRFAGDNMSVELFDKILVHLAELDIVDRRSVTSIWLYNWGDPFNNPNLDGLLASLRTHGFKGSMSSNFARAPEIDDANLSTISHMTLSLSGISEETYGRIHGISLKKVLKNFDEFYARARCHAPKMVFHISWHRYRFNESEFWDAYRYFGRPNVVFSPVVAFLNDHVDAMEFMEGAMPEQRKANVERDLFIDHIEKNRVYHQQHSHDYLCPQWDALAINENGRLQLCCGFTSQDTECLFGSILDMTRDDIWQTRPHHICQRCISSGWARCMHNVTARAGQELAFPKGGGLSVAKFALERTFSMEKLYTMLQNSKPGRGIIMLAKKARS
ncbi:MAG: hypothetical protein HQ523_01800 [Lentisphaerae bacterium]|nr:hypothetical protein [Lentisphaerota bacterium]